MSPHRQCVDAFLEAEWDRRPFPARSLEIGAARARGWRPPGAVTMDLAPGAAYRGDVQSLPHRDGAFEVVVCAEMLYLVDAGAAAREMARVLAPGGTLLGTVPFLHPPMEAEDWGRATARVWTAILDAAGYHHINVVPLGGPWTGVCQIAHRTGPRWLGALARRVAPLARRWDRRRESAWPLAWGFVGVRA